MAMPIICDIPQLGPSLIIDDTHMLIPSSVNQMAQLQPVDIQENFILSIVFHLLSY